MSDPTTEKLENLSIQDNDLATGEFDPYSPGSLQGGLAQGDVDHFGGQPQQQIANGLEPMSVEQIDFGPYSKHIEGQEGMQGRPMDADIERKMSEREMLGYQNDYSGTFQSQGQEEYGTDSEEEEDRNNYVNLGAMAPPPTYGEEQYHISTGQPLIDVGSDQPLIDVGSEVDMLSSDDRGYSADSSQIPSSADIIGSPDGTLDMLSPDQDDWAPHVSPSRARRSRSPERSLSPSDHGRHSGSDSMGASSPTKSGGNKNNVRDSKPGKKEIHKLGHIPRLQGSPKTTRAKKPLELPPWDDNVVIPPPPRMKPTLIGKQSEITSPSRPKTAPSTLQYRKTDASSDSGVEEDKASRKVSVDAKKKYGIDSKNVKYKPGGGNIKIFSEKLDTKSVAPKTDTKPSRASMSPPGSTSSDRSPMSPQLPSPNVKNVQSKIGSLANTKHSPGGGNVKILTAKVDYSSVSSKVGSKDKIDHKPKGGDKKIQSEKLTWNAGSKIGSLKNVTHSPGGGTVKSLAIECFDEDSDWATEAEVTSQEDLEHVPGGGNVKILSERLKWKAEPKVDTNLRRHASTGSYKLCAIDSGNLARFTSWKYPLILDIKTDGTQVQNCLPEISQDTEDEFQVKDTVIDGGMLTTEAPDSAVCVTASKPVHNRIFDILPENLSDFQDVTETGTVSITNSQKSLENVNSFEENRMPLKVENVSETEDITIECNLMEKTEPLEQDELQSYIAVYKLKKIKPLKKNRPNNQIVNSAKSVGKGFFNGLLAKPKNWIKARPFRKRCKTDSEMIDEWPDPQSSANISQGTELDNTNDCIEMANLGYVSPKIKNKLKITDSFKSPESNTGSPKLGVNYKAPKQNSRQVVMKKSLIKDVEQPSGVGHSGRVSADMFNNYDEFQDTIEGIDMTIGSIVSPVRNCESQSHYAEIHTKNTGVVPLAEQTNNMQHSQSRHGHENAVCYKTESLYSTVKKARKEKVENEPREERFETKLEFPLKDKPVTNSSKLVKSVNNSTFTSKLDGVLLSSEKDTTKSPSKDKEGKTGSSCITNVSYRYEEIKLPNVSEEKLKAQAVQETSLLQDNRNIIEIPDKMEHIIGSHAKYSHDSGQVPRSAGHCTNGWENVTSLPGRGADKMPSDDDHDTRPYRILKKAVKGKGQYGNKSYDEKEETSRKNVLKIGVLPLKQEREWEVKSKMPGCGDDFVCSSVKDLTMILDQKVEVKAQSKIGSTANIKHKPGGGEKKIETQKVDFSSSAKSKVGSMDNVKHKPTGGDIRVRDEKLSWEVSSKVGSLDNVKHTPGGGKVQVRDEKLVWDAASKVGSLDNAKHVPGGGKVKIFDEKVDFAEIAGSKVGSLDKVDHKPGGGDKKIETQTLHFKETAKARTDTGAGSGGDKKRSATSSRSESVASLHSNSTQE